MAISEISTIVHTESQMPMSFSPKDCPREVGKGSADTRKDREHGEFYSRTQNRDGRFSARSLSCGDCLADIRALERRSDALLFFSPQDARCLIPDVLVGAIPPAATHGF